MKKKRKKKNEDKKRKSWDRSYNDERVRAKWCCCAFKLGFLQLTCKASIIFESNLELALSVILKQRELYESKHVAVECRCLKIWDLLSFLTCSSILVLKYFVVDQLTCASCSSSYIGETCCHFKTRIEEHIKKDNKSHIFKHLHSTATYFDSYNSLCFKTTDKANSKLDLNIKEGLHIIWRKPNLNVQQNHLALIRSL